MEQTTPPVIYQSFIDLFFDRNGNSSLQMTTPASLIDPNANYTQLDMFFINNNQLVTVVLYILYSLIFILGICGNTIVIYVLISSICVDRRYQFIQNNQTVAHLIATAIPNRQAQFKPASPLVTSTRKSLINGDDLEASVIIDNGDASMISPPAVARIKTPQQAPHRDRQNSLRTRSASIFKKIVREKLTVTNLYLLNLALCDFLYVLSIPILLCTIYFNRWMFNRAVCKIYFTQIYLCQCSIVFILVVLSIDRYLSVKYPHKVTHFRNDKIARVTICASWLLSFFVISPITIFTELQYSEDPTFVATCVIHW
jgi:hypothetical protein